MDTMHTLQLLQPRTRRAVPARHPVVSASSARGSDRPARADRRAAAARHAAVLHARAARHDDAVRAAARLRGEAQQAFVGALLGALRRVAAAVSGRRMLRTTPEG